MNKNGCVYVLLSKHQGSNNQLVALASALKGNSSIKPVRCELRSRKKLFYPFYKVLCKILITFKIPSFIRRVFINCSFVGDRPRLYEGDVIVGKTPPFEVPMMLLAQGTGAQVFFIGEPKHFSKDLFDYLISTPSTPVSSASIFLSMMPTHINYDDTLILKKSVQRESPPWLYLLGGDTSGFEYDQDHWEQLCDMILEHIDEYDKKVLISTSPRTGPLGENVIRRRLQGNKQVENLFLWGEKKDTEESLLETFIAISECIFVTEDSAGMISDALISRRPLFSLRLQEDSYNSLSTPLAIYHASHHHLLRMIIGDDRVDLYRWCQDCFVPLQHSWYEELFAQLPV